MVVCVTVAVGVNVLAPDKPAVGDHVKFKKSPVIEPSRGVGVGGLQRYMSSPALTVMGHWLNTGCKLQLKIASQSKHVKDEFFISIRNRMLSTAAIGNWPYYGLKAKK